MSNSLNMTLDDMVKRSRSERTGGRGRPRHGRGTNGFSRGGRPTGPVRRGPLAVNARASSFTINKPARRVTNLPWQNGLFEDSLRAAGISGIEVGTKLNVSNLDNGVTNEDIRELFSEIGELRRYAIHYDKFGRPSGSAEVVYVRRSDAFQALKRYNNVLLDGKPMRIEIVVAKSEIPVSARVNVIGTHGMRKRTVTMTPGMGQGRGAAPINWRPALNRRGGMASRGGMTGRGGMSGRGGARGGGRTQGQSRGRGQGRGRGRGRGRGEKKPVEKSVAELDKELDSYHSEAMNTS